MAKKMAKEGGGAKSSGNSKIKGIKGGRKVHWKPTRSA